GSITGVGGARDDDIEVSFSINHPSAPTPDYPIEIHSVNNFDSISQKATVDIETAVDGIEIGGRNLISNSTMGTNDGWQTGGNLGATSDGEIISITNTTGNYPRLLKIIDFEIEDSEEYTLSFEARTDNPRA